MAGYSGTPLLQKLGIKPGVTIAVINAPGNYRKLLGPIANELTFSERAGNQAELVHLFRTFGRGGKVEREERGEREMVKQS
jgi:hypothetical protein